MNPGSVRVISVRAGRVQPTGSWLYAWIDVATRAVVYVGGTGVDPELRAHLHVSSEDPAIGRVRARIPRYAERTFEVLAFPLPGAVDRAAAKDLLVARLSDGGRPAVAGETTGSLDEVIDSIVRAVRARQDQVPADTSDL